MPHETPSQEARLAVAVNDIDWIKKSQEQTNTGIQQLQATLTQHIKEQNERAEKYATKKEIKDIQNDVNELKKFRWLVTGAAALAGFLSGQSHSILAFFHGGK